MYPNSSEFFGTTAAIKGTFSVNKMVVGSVTPAVISGISEKYTALALDAFENIQGPAKIMTIDLLYKSYLSQVGNTVTHWKGANTGY